MTPSSDIQTLRDIMARLRDPENGCPWDAVQDFKSIAPYTIEEAYEVADAIERDDMVDLKEELGDLLLQPVYHAQMAAEAGHFSFDDVVLAVTQKLIRRHPHVFGNAEARAARSAKGQWERIKAEERAEKAAAKTAMGVKADRSVTSILDDVPQAFPALMRAEKLQSRAARVGFDWPELSQVLDKAREEWEEFEEELAKLKQDSADQARLSEEFGDFLFTIVNLARHLGIDPEAALKATNRKFTQRFQHIEAVLEDRNQQFEDVSLDEMEAIWQSAKGNVE